MKKIIVPIDGSKHANLAIEKAKEFAQSFDCKIVLLNSYDVHNLYMDLQVANRIKSIDLDKPQEDSKALLETAKQSLKDFGERVEMVSVEGDPANEIIKYVEGSDADMVIMGSHGLKGVQRFLIGSVTNKVLHHIEKPILIVR
ncbi:universal stress protein [Anaerotalea alkaliphila]|uniref:Universal stress protein n=1 Tax=Anaerotalea alkaliphila TaxID=2662126 RepID=A0A7X5HUH0_9FIRM|nr:universal stress protein [Anaerotalea alkaliphila]NDL66855.1 universal stress protein [Anaerotalea alkaliphila]